MSEHMLIEKSAWESLKADIAHQFELEKKLIEDIEALEITAIRYEISLRRIAGFGKDKPNYPLIRAFHTTIIEIAEEALSEQT